MLVFMIRNLKKHCCIHRLIFFKKINSYKPGDIMETPLRYSNIAVGFQLITIGGQPS